VRSRPPAGRARAQCSDVRTGWPSTPSWSTRWASCVRDVTPTGDLQRSWNEHVGQVRERIDAGKARHDAKVAQREAEAALDYAEFTIDFAYGAIEQAEYAVLDATLARMNADAASTKVSG
jgi:hypothetical protein